VDSPNPALPPTHSAAHVAAQTLPLEVGAEVQQSPPINWKKILWLELRAWFSILVPFWAFTTFFFSISAVDGVSMMPTLRQGERLLIPKWETWLHTLGIGNFKRGDVVVFKPPANAPEAWHSFYGMWNYHPYFVKRIIALGGDTIRLEGGTVSVNGHVSDYNHVHEYWVGQNCLDQSSSLANNARNTFERDPISQSFIVPKGEYFVMGDNRSEGGSEDSRMFGSIPLEQIAGRVSAIWFPWSRQVNASYNCANAQVTLSGPTENNLRLLP
jgi:signal peptidase I